MAFQLTKEQQAAADLRGSGLLVSAAAGSGKTRVLVERLLGRVEAGADIDRFLVITYTKAGAAELRGRIAKELSDRLALRPEDAWLRRQATLAYKAGICTIDAFCTQFLREEGHRLDLDHDFRVCEESEAQVLMEDALREVLEERYEAIEPGDDFSFLVDTMSDGRDDSKLQTIVMDVRRSIQSHPDPAGWLREQERVFALEGITDAGDTPWGKVLLADVKRQSLYWAGRMMEAVSLCQGDPVLEKAYAPSLQATFQHLTALAGAADRGWDEAAGKARLVDFPRLGSSRGCEDAAALERIKSLRERCKKRVEKLAEGLAVDSAGLLEDMRAVYPAVRGLFALVRDLEERYSQMKRKRSLVDFSDVEHMTVSLLVGEDGGPTELAKRWGERYDEVMVDEFQDVNAVQNTIFTALSGEGKRLFTVGDVKQSIYRFRLADPTIFLDKYRSYPLWERAAEEGENRKVLLSQNFRSRPQVLEGCNYLFRSIMSVPFGEMDYTDAEALIPGGSFVSAEGEQDPYAVELDLVDCSEAREEDEGGRKPPKDLLEARSAARRIRELLDQGFPVSDGEGGLRPARPGDVVILLRSPGPVLPYYAKALGEWGIPWEAEGAGDFFGAEEVQVALSFLRIMDNFRQDVPLIAALRSPVCAFSADRLAQIRARAPEADFYTALTMDDGEDVKSFLAEMAALRSRAGDESCDRLLWRLYDRTNLLGIYTNLEDGESRRGNLLLLAQLARELEETGHKGLYGFLSYLERLESAGKAPSPPRAGVGSGVKIMSIHRSKGLEFPVVLLCGLCHQPNKADARRAVPFHAELGVGPKRLDLERMIESPTLARMAVVKKLEQEQGAEELRLLYVAMTRAKEKLILSCALTKGREDLQKLATQVGAPVEPQALLDSQSPAQWVLLAALARPEAREYQSREFPPAVEAHIGLGPAWDFRWVDGKELVAAPERAGAEERAEKAGAREGLAQLFRWVYPYSLEAGLPSKVTATQLKGRELDNEAGEEAPKPPRPFRFERPRFAAAREGLTPAQKGTALHLVMQYIDFDACVSPEAVGEEILRLTEGEFITPQQAQAVDPERVWQFFASPLGREVTASSTLRREFKFSILVPAGQYWPQAGEGEQVLLQGVVDCYFKTRSGITVVDFKTDNVKGDAITARAEEYKPQLEAYAQALAEITGSPVTRRVLWFFSEGKAVEV